MRGSWEAVAPRKVLAGVVLVRGRWICPASFLSFSADPLAVLVGNIECRHPPSPLLRGFQEPTMAVCAVVFDVGRETGRTEGRQRVEVA